jgi:inner membrane protein involved in colicin E2 resistance
MRTLFVSLSLLLLSILLVIGCEVIDKTIQDDSQLETRVIQQTSDIEKVTPYPDNIELTDIELDNKEKVQKTDDS